VQQLVKQREARVERRAHSRRGIEAGQVLEIEPHAPEHERASQPRPRGDGRAGIELSEVKELRSGVVLDHESHPGGERRLQDEPCGRCAALEGRGVSQREGAVGLELESGQPGDPPEALHQTLFVVGGKLMR
jgi:hypothetical protein